MPSSSPNYAIAIPWLLSLATIGIGIWEFTAQQATANRKPFLEKQLELGLEATQAAAVLATETDKDKWEASRKKFWQLYWGPLSMVEDRAVEKAMVDFGKSLPTQPVAQVSLPVTTLQGPTYQLAHSVRDLVLASWKVDMPALEGKPAQ